MTRNGPELSAVVLSVFLIFHLTTSPFVDFCNTAPQLTFTRVAMMDPATARVALKLQLEDVDAILKTLSNTSTDAIAESERAAFTALRQELTKKWNEVHGQAYAYHVVQQESAEDGLPEVVGRRATG
ncbi:hypothetical protein NX059_004181 [Plenodomus lindquistii]|nr:hypothetical protein NX059_004181 [Plenodomus lindquistii]